MRSWSSPTMQQDVPELAGRLRDTIFEELEPFREQADRECELLIQTQRREVNDAKAEASAAKAEAYEALKRLADKEAEVAALRAALASGSQVARV